MTYRVSLGKTQANWWESSKSTGRCDLDGGFFFNIVAADTRRAHLLIVPLTTQTDIAPVKYNLELTGE